MVIGMEVLASNISAFLTNLAPTISIILIVLGGIVYGLSYTQPPDKRGEWQNAAMGMFVGGVVVAAVAASATFIQQQATGLLKPV